MFDIERQRRHVRLPGHSYNSPGSYFITLCTLNRDCYLGEVVGDQVELSREGEIAWKEWTGLAASFPGLTMDTHIVMPNHLHGILILDGVTPGCPIVGNVIRRFKSATIQQARRMPIKDSEMRWQRNYYEHIIRSEDDLVRIREYVDQNPLRWAQAGKRE